MRIIGNDPNTPRQTQVVASGTLSTGDTVIVNADGTVSAAAFTDATSGSSVNFDGLDGQMGLSYDSANGKVVIAYKDAGNSNYGTAIVGTVSGTSISFGTPVVFNTTTTYGFSIAFDANAGKHVIIYIDGSNTYGTSIVGTVSGTSISFGTAVVFESWATTETSIAYNSALQKVVLFYRSTPHTNDGILRVGTVSGTSISYGTVNRFENGCENQTICYDSGNDKMVIAYRDGGSGDRGVARVVTVNSASETTPGSEVVYNTGASFRNQIVYDPNLAKVVIAYADEGNSYYGTAIAGEVSGTSITFGAEQVFKSAQVSYLGITYDSSVNKSLIVYQDGSTTSVVPVELSGTTVSFGTSTTVDSSGTAYRQQIVYDATSGNNVVGLQTNGNNGYAIVYQAGSTNLTAENYIGTAKSGAADGDGVVVNTQGNVDTSQTGLTAGQSYYVQTDGTLSTTAGDPSVFAGTAVSATKLIVKG